jgi:hypothetical protein
MIRSVNPQVVGSNPTRGAIQIKDLAAFYKCLGLFYLTDIRHLSNKTLVVTPAIQLLN